jgi:AraC-like DNA-binding protein
VPSLVRGSAPATLVVAFTPRERARAMARAALPRRVGRLTHARTPDEFAALFRDELVDVALVDVGAPSEQTLRAAQLAREFPSVTFLGIAPYRSVDAPMIAQCAALEFADVLADGVDESALRHAVLTQSYTARFADALREPPSALRLTSPAQRATWAQIVARAGRPLRTAEVAKALGVTREHLSRSFAANGGPNLKRVIDLVRLVAAAELAKNPGYDVRAVAHVLGYASSAHLSTASHRVLGTAPASLARLRIPDLIERFAKGRGRSRSR